MLAFVPQMPLNITRLILATPVALQPTPVLVFTANHIALYYSNGHIGYTISL